LTFSVSHLAHTPERAAPAKVKMQSQPEPKLRIFRWVQNNKALGGNKTI
jgi:hypothetical protein